jgi:hypothetical protein
MASTALDHVLADVKVPKQKEVLMGRCDLCGERAAHEATKDRLRLSFCGHHAREKAQDILSKGFRILPENYLFDLND